MWWWASWGMAGAFVYGQAALIFAIWDSGGTPCRRYKAVAEFVAGLITGAVFAAGWTPTLRDFVAKWIEADGVAVALWIGWVSNYLWPKLLKLFGARVEKLAGKGPSV